MDDTNTAADGYYGKDNVDINEELDLSFLDDKKDEK
jgi:hypothetical protein